MTRHQRSLSSPPRTDKSGLLRPLARARKLPQVILERIATEIMSGRLAPGSRLPTEQALMQAYGVSRTVVREAVAALKADGLVRTRQGSGAYVADVPHRSSFRIDDESSAIEGIIHVMELRLAVEVEAAGLAAERADALDRRRIVAAQGRFAAAVARGEPAIAEDFDLHVAIAEAAHNPQFTSFLSFLGGHVIPRQSIRARLASPGEQRTYLARLEHEHARIVEAVTEANVRAARNSMRAHIRGSLQRYRRFSERSQAAGRADTPFAGKNRGSRAVGNTDEDTSDRSD